jgi:RNA polymerase sigma-70 factor (ECF subfamily)
MKPDTEALTWERWLQNGDADAFAEVSRLYAGMVYGTCLRITGDREQAADAARETFFQLLTHARQVTGSIGGRLHQVATRRAIDLVRRDVARRRRQAAFAAGPLQETDNWADISPVVDEALGELDPDWREILLRHYLQGQSMTEIGAARGRLVEQCLPPTGLGGIPRLDGRIGGTTFAALSL